MENASRSDLTIMESPKTYLAITAETNLPFNSNGSLMPLLLLLLMDICVFIVRSLARTTKSTEVSVFLFEKRIAEKLHKPKRKETVAEVLRASVRQLERFRHPRVLQVVHPVEECSETLAFAAEPVLSSLSNILSWPLAQGQPAGTSTSSPGSGSKSTNADEKTPAAIPPFAREYRFLDIEFKYGILQEEVKVKLG
ncbi:hypothetical protein J437_LFUL000420 [Ladona fulva]|uniref:Uncharacterized protein n=1 Tax=Ladona fulva TaxID=123851 RepID=A0A8K0K426_LADFU|nr:hypothetical protein J437_LFUL000420 [Ladona fulva]